jgi:DNA polymerase III epsilon subunit-like protein
MKPFSDNIIFVDTEFSTLDPYQGEILSIALVKLNGDTLYLELEYDGSVSEWVKTNILPTLKGPKVSRDEAKRKVKEFTGDTKPYMVSYVNQYDVIYFYKLFGVENQPCYWLPVDFASILFSAGADPEKLLDFGRKLGVHTGQYHLHSALDDAKLLREVYLAFFKRET